MLTLWPPKEIGCLIGALSNLWLGDRLGRRRTIVVGGCIMIIGAILQTTSYGYAQLVVARIITGLGNGLNVGEYHVNRRVYRLIVCRRRPCQVITRNVRLLPREAA